MTTRAQEWNAAAEYARALDVAADRMRDAAARAEREARLQVPALKPGSIIRCRRSGRLYVVKQANGAPVIDTLGNDGVRPLGNALLYDMVQGAPEEKFNDDPETASIRAQLDHIDGKNDD